MSKSGPAAELKMTLGAVSKNLLSFREGIGPPYLKYFLKIPANYIIKSSSDIIKLSLRVRIIRIAFTSNNTVTTSRR